MVGHLKFCLVLFIGYVLFQAPLGTNQICGVLSTLLGVFYYSRLKLKEQNNAKTIIAQKNNSKISMRSV